MINAIKELLGFVKKSRNKKDIPIGACIIDKNNKIISIAKNLKEKHKNAFLHAEIVAIRKAARKIKNWYLDEFKIITTLEPCPMCYFAIKEARINEIIYLAKDFKGGALNGKINLSKEFNHKVKITFIENEEASLLIKNFFKKLRK